MDIAILTHDDDATAPVLRAVPYPGMKGGLWHSDAPIVGALPPTLLFWHADLDAVPDHPRAGSCPVFSDALVRLIWGEDLGACERIPVVVGDAPEPTRQRSGFSAVHVLPVQGAGIVDTAASVFEAFVPGSPIWGRIERLRLHADALPTAPVFRIPQFRSALFLHGPALARVRSARPSGLTLVPLDAFQADG
jgi:hypothetical protein